MPEAVVFNIQKFCLHDGDGIRTAIFFKGCPLECKWCHNPEGQARAPQLMVYPERCRHCGRCEQICPQKCASIPAFTACGACGLCVDACAYGAREIVGKHYTLETLVRIAERDIMFYEASSGGITLSGGEVMTQERAFLLPFVRALKRKGFDIAIDTCGHAPFEAFADVLPYTDTFLYDIKLIESERHRRFTGQDNGLILSNLQKLSDMGARLHVRIPLIEEVNASSADMDAIIRVLAGIRVERISLLPYHNTGRDKYARLGMANAEDFHAPDTQRVRALAEKLRRSGFAVQIGG